ncbi:MAG: sugar-binding domain-containing protein, partial [Anaerolineales bacterium]
MTKSMLRRGIALFLTAIVPFISFRCGAMPTAEPTPSEAATMSADPIPAVLPVSIPLSGEWRFSIDRDRAGEKQGWFDPDYDDSSWATVNVPHTWNVMPEYSGYEGLAWYRRTVAAPSELENAHLRLKFDAVFYLARVWLNGQYLGQHEGGYTSFEFDVTSLVEPGAENIVAIQVDNLRTMNRIPVIITPDWSFDWWNYGGITRDVSLEVTSQAYIARQQIVSVPHLTGMDEADAATVTATITVSNTSDGTLEGTVLADLLDGANGQSVLLSPLSAPVRVAAKDSAEIQITAIVKAPKLWHFDHPNLYRWSVSLHNADKEV